VRLRNILFREEIVMKYSLLSVLMGSLLLVGCGGDDKKEDLAPPVKTEISPVEALKQLEQSGISLYLIKILRFQG
jgi:hypothetical protein